ncbi:MAG: phosphoglycerate dehydrogenase [Anaerolineales bacterium]|nr:phosphoglycerate dehydrogenase [Anaerolineales bacterium]
MYRILVADRLGTAGLERLSQAADAACDVRADLDKPALLAVMPQYDALIVRSGTQVDADVLRAGTQLRVVGRAGVGIDNIDLATATQLGIVVTNTPTANNVATAEQTLGLMLAVSRHTAVAHAALTAGEWDRGRFVGTQLCAKTLGIIGLGHIGRLVAARAQAFGMEVVAYDPYISEEVGRQENVTLVDLDELLPQADYVSLHAALTPETTHLINADTLGQMKPGAILINVARGRLVDEQALAAALQTGRLRAAALDVFAEEPPRHSPLIGLPNVLHTPHLAASSVEAQRDVAIQIVEQVLDALRQHDFRHAVNMPFQAGPGFRAIRPYMALAETLGRLQARLADGPIEQVEVQVNGDAVAEMVRAIAAALLKGLLHGQVDGPLNSINAPLLAEQRGIHITQTTGIDAIDYANLISCRVSWPGGGRLVSGVLFGGSEPRIAQIDRYRLEARPEGVLLFMQNRDVPGVIGQIGTILAAYEVNIGEWRLGRNQPGGAALSCINLDSVPPPAAIDALKNVAAVTMARLVDLTA